MDEKGETILSGEPQAEPVAKESPKEFTRRQVVAGGVGIGLIGLIAGGALAKWGVVEDTIARGQVAVDVTPTKLIVTDRARCSGCQRCELMCSLRNDGRACQATARVRVWQNYNYGEGSHGPDGIYRNCQFTVEHCKQCKEAACMRNCPVHAIYADPKTGARVVDTDACIGCGLCHEACPWNMPQIDPASGKSTKCIACGRCAVQCPNGAIKFVDWQDIAQEAIDKGIVRTATLFPED
ncbi:4Fe-4S binding protein [Slackia exigua]|uniref:4Fe-4S binding protein n=1 Tax=Slackia exigua TaxID=84109 RepID=UPI0028E52578|nr:4Fe-4S binding protein [Slackia exigua]